MYININKATNITEKGPHLAVFRAKIWSPCAIHNVFCWLMMVVYIYIIIYIYIHIIYTYNIIYTYIIYIGYFADAFRGLFNDSRCAIRESCPWNLLPEIQQVKSLLGCGPNSDSEHLESTW